jgi:hypothetical protein
MIIVGDIPKSISYVYSGTKNLYSGPDWNLKTYYSAKNKEEVTPAEVADSNDSLTLNIAKKNIQRLNYKTASGTNILSIDNTPIKNIRLFSLQKRFGGNSHYKILINNFLLDLKQDVLMETILTEGAKSGGILQGEFIWAKFGSKLKLIRIGSELYNSILEFKNKEKLPSIKKKDLVIGGVYQTVRKDCAIYLGEVNTTLQKSNGASNKFKFVNNFYKKNMLFCNIFPNENPEDLLSSASIEKDIHRFVIKSSHKFIEKVDNISVPDTIISSIREAGRKRVKKYIVQYTASKNGRFSAISSLNYLEYLISNFSKIINMTPSNAAAVEVFDAYKYLALT